MTDTTIPATYRVGLTGRMGLGGAVRHAVDPKSQSRSLCSSPLVGLPSGVWSPDHPRACPRCKREAKRRG